MALFVAEGYRKMYANLAPNLASFFSMIANIDENVARVDGMLGSSGLRQHHGHLYD